MQAGQHGTTMVIDTGLPTRAFTDLDAGVGFYFGGTLFEHSVWTGRLAEYLTLVGTNRAIPLRGLQRQDPAGPGGQGGLRLAALRDPAPSCPRSATRTRTARRC